MATTLATLLTRVRSRHWAFTVDRIPDRAIGNYLTDAQNELLALATRLDRQYLAQTMTIALALDAANAPSAVGADTDGGLPAMATTNGVATVATTAGSLAEVSDAVADGATVILSDRLVSAATASTIASTGAARTTNADVGRHIVITAGPGYGQRREIASNTSDAWTLTDDWTTTPTVGTTLFALVDAVDVVDATAGVVTALPATADAPGYLVKLDATGQPYLDYTAPVLATIEQGVPLPAWTMLLPSLSQVWSTDGTRAPLSVIPAIDRHQTARGPSVYVVGQTLYLTGDTADWTDIASLELRYVPLAPAFASTADYCLLPDPAVPCLVAMAGAFCAMRVQGLDGVTVDPAPHAAEAERAQRDFRRTVVSGTRGRLPSRIAEMW